jgi:hypothetical protein
MIDKVTKTKLTSIDKLREGHMVTRDYRKSTEGGWTVKYVDDETAMLVDRNGKKLWITNRTVGSYDLSVADSSPHAG